MRRSTSILFASVTIFLWITPAAAQRLADPVAGPVIEDFGAVYAVAAPDFATPSGPFKVVFEVALGAPEPDQLNARLETVARYLNMHAQAGVAVEDMEVALVVHGSAGKDLLAREGFRARHGVDNPNYDMVQQLIEAGVEVVLCGQTQVHRGLRRDQLAPGVKVALSAMTVLVTLQSRGYQLIAF